MTTTHEATLPPTDHDPAPAPTGPAEGRLVVRRGLGRTTIAGDPALSGLYSARFTGRPPHRAVHGGTVELTYPRPSLTGRRAADELTLATSVPWRIEVDGGVGEVTADLRDVNVQSVDVSGGVADTSIDLAAPTGTLQVRLGSAADVVIRRPAGVEVRVAVRRGARHLRVDDQVLGAVGGPTVVATPGYAGATDRIDIAVGACQRLTVTTYPEA
jgi:hypothetical protein